ncbi:hypothetical protein SUGI_1037620 [Cryptomeria japonica]|nr:hypothetical protein SUGI_1037620 [Cryptomeria japonica]
MELNVSPGFGLPPNPVPSSHASGPECPSDGNNTTLPIPPKPVTAIPTRPKTFSEAVSNVGFAVDVSARFLCPASDGASNAGHRRRDCPIIQRKLDTPSDKTTRDNPPQIPPSNNTSASQPVQPSTQNAHLNPHCTPLSLVSAPPQITNTVSPLPTQCPDASAGISDGFLTTTKKRRRKTNSKKDVLNPQAPPISNSSISDFPLNCDLTDKTCITPKALTSHKTLKEIDDNCTIEVIPACNPTMVSCNIKQPMEEDKLMMLESDYENEGMEEFPISKRRGRPTGSKNKNSGNKKKEDPSPNNATPIQGAGMQCLPLTTGSQ